ncbi:MAG: hypothetical protein IPP71_03785 [Bacteroidetes bacterium]|nr:hypothetical protein [Bacteroidota bacterium]
MKTQLFLRVVSGFKRMIVIQIFPQLLVNTLNIGLYGGIKRIFDIYSGWGLALLYFILKRDLYYSLCIFTVPLSVAVAFAGGSSLSAPSEIMVLILAIVTLVLLVSKTEQFRTILIHPLSLILLADLVWMTIAAIYSEMPLISFKRVVARFLFLTVFYILTAHWFEKKNACLSFFLFTFGLIVPILFTFYKHSSYGLIQELFMN